MCGKVASIFSDLIKKADIFSVGVGFNIHNEDAYSTILGGLVFIGYSLLCAYFVVFNFFSFANRSNYNQNLIDVKSDTAPPINLIDEKLGFALGLTVDGTPVTHTDSILKDYITIDVAYVTKYTENSTKAKRNLNLTQCEKQFFRNSINDTFELFDLQNYQCIDPFNNFDLILKGIYTDPIFQYIEFSIKINEEGKNHGILLNDYFLDHEAKMQLFYLDSSINVSNYSSPEYLYLNSKYLQLSFPFLLKANADFSNNTFENDANILLSSSTSFNFFTLDSFDQTNSYLGNDRLIEKKLNYDTLGKMYIRASQYSITYKRTYQKITEYLADSTAIVSQVLFLLVLLIGEYDQFKVKEYIIDNMLKYKLKFKKDNPKGFRLMKKLFSENDYVPENPTRQNTNENLSGPFFSSPRQYSPKNQNTKSTKENDELTSPVVITNKKFLNTLNLSNKINGKKIKVLPKNNHNNYIISNKNNNIGYLRNDIDEQIKPIPQTEDAYVSSSTKTEAIVPLYINYLSPSIQRTYTNQQNNKNLETTNETLIYSWLDLIKIFFSKIGCCKKDKHFRNKEEMFEKGLERYFNNLDVFTYFKKIRELDILNHILLNSNQKNLVDFLSKPSVSLIIKDKESPLAHSLNQFENTPKQIKKFYSSFISCNDEYLKHQSTVNEKLLQLTSYELFQLIQEENE